MDKDRGTMADYGVHLRNGHFGRRTCYFNIGQMNFSRVFIPSGDASWQRVRKVTVRETAVTLIDRN